MKMRTLSADNKRQLEEKVNKLGIGKEQIINVFQEKDQTYTVIYFVED